MSPTRRRALAVAAAAHLAVVAVLFGDVTLPVFNVLLVSAAPSLVWLLWMFCQWSAHQHARRWQRDIQKVHGVRPVRLPERTR